MTNIDNLIQSVKNDVINWRRHIHQNPELSFEEYNTSKYIYEQLSKFEGLTLSTPTQTSVIAHLDTNKPGPTIALRADIDALPIIEKSGESFSSTNEGVMHACGHDAHTSMLLGAVKVICQIKAQLCGKIVFIFQPAEELPPGGAKELIKKGVLKDVDMIFGMHVAPNLPTGKIALKYGSFCASSDNFDIIIHGVGGHGSAPEDCIDPIVIGAQIVTALQTIVSRNINPLQAPVISVTKFSSGDSYNVIPMSAKLCGTFRTHHKNVRENVPKLMERIISGITQAHGAKYEFNWEEGYPIGNNDKNVCDIAKEVIKKVVGEKNIYLQESPIFGGEDFSSYQEVIPGCFIGLGSMNKEKSAIYGLHSAKFILDEDALEIGVKMHVNFVQHVLMNK